MPIEAQDYDSALEAVRRQRDNALHELEQCKLVPREILAMNVLGMGLSIAVNCSEEASQKWQNLVNMASTTIGVRE